MLEVWRMGKDFAVLLTAKPDLPLKKNKPLPHVDNPLSVRFENVSFRYPHRDECVLKDVSFTIHPGECVAFVGENGAGKSTIVKLICRFYDVTQGRILINGIDIREIDIDQLRNAISVVFQQFGQYGLTLAENVAIGDLRKRDKIEEIKRVIRQVDMEEEVARLQKGYRQIMGREWNGTDLSGGQWQRIAIARAFMRDSKAKLLIFDEPSSALDDYTEYEIIQSLKQLGQNKTVIFVTHHLANAKLADHILLLDQGRVIEQGDHHTLIGKKGIYMEWVNLYQEMKEGKKLSSAN